MKFVFLKLLNRCLKMTKKRDPLFTPSNNPQSANLSPFYLFSYILMISTICANATRANVYKETSSEMFLLTNVY